MEEFTMIPIQCILHPTDFSAGSEATLQLACAVACDYNARLIIVYVAEFPMSGSGEGVITPDPAKYEEELFHRFHQLKAHHPDLDLDRRLVLDDDPAQAIVEQARANACDLIIMATHGRTGLGRLFLGSVAEEVIRKAPCPVLTVRMSRPRMTKAKRAEPAKVKAALTAPAN
jgi:nucleotide-binding universal stress UspA family protein